MIRFFLGIALVLAKTREVAREAHSLLIMDGGTAEDRKGGTVRRHLLHKGNASVSKKGTGSLAEVGQRTMKAEARKASANVDPKEAAGTHESGLRPGMLSFLFYPISLAERSDILSKFMWLGFSSVWVFAIGHCLSPILGCGSMFVTRTPASDTGSSDLHSTVQDSTAAIAVKSPLHGVPLGF